MSIFFGTVLPWLLIAVGTWLVYQLARQNGRILLRLEAIDERLSPREVLRKTDRPQKRHREAVGLPVGTPAPDFELPDLTGVRHKLSDYHGKELLVVFFNPKCGFCTKMAADLAGLPAARGDGGAVPIVVTTGDAEENRKLVEQYGIRCLVLMQEQMEIASQFRAQGTPMGYRIDGAGRVASELAVGAEPLLRLAAAASPGQGDAVPSANSHQVKVHKDDPSLARSRLNRNGLKAGTAAPDFQLPSIDQGELSLAEFRGGRVLLVFSDPDCGPCDELAPRLQGIHEERPDLTVLVVGRRDAEANRAKATALGLTYPIVLQRQWEISLLYAKFATPIGYLVDEQGILLSDVAVGVDPILALAGEQRAEPFVAELSRSRKEPAFTN
jgi:peroxiredoxin